MEPPSPGREGILAAVGRTNRNKEMGPGKCSLHGKEHTESFETRFLPIVSIMHTMEQITRMPVALAYSAGREFQSPECVTRFIFL